MSSIMRISSLYNYPIKGCGEISLTTAELEQRGIKFDRNWMLIDENGKQITQRDVAKATLIKPALNGNGVMRLIAPGMTELLLTASLE